MRQQHTCFFMNNAIILYKKGESRWENKSEKYLLEFKDEIKRDIFEYLIDDNSDYRITRLSDNVVLRDTKEDYVSKYGHYPTVRKIKIDDTNRKRLVLEK